MTLLLTTNSVVLVGPVLDLKPERPGRLETRIVSSVMPRYVNSERHVALCKFKVYFWPGVREESVQSAQHDATELAMRVSRRPVLSGVRSTHSAQKDDGGGGQEERQQKPSRLLTRAC